MRPPGSKHNCCCGKSCHPSSAVRLLVPVEVYRPGHPTPEAPPKDYLTYLQEQTNYSAELSKVTKITVDGHPATLMNVTRTIDANHPEGLLDGSLGCPNAAPTEPRAASDHSRISFAWPSSTWARPRCSPGPG
jgi:hypothetical protein